MVRLVLIGVGGRASRALMFSNRQLWVVSTASCIRSIGFGASWPFMAIFFNKNLGIPIFYVGIIFTLLALSSSVFSIIGGQLSDSIGRKNTLLIGSIYGVFVFFALAYFVAYSYPLALIVAVFILSALGGAFVFPSTSALVADVTEEKDRNMAYSIYRIMSNIGWAIGPITGGYLTSIDIVWMFVLVGFSSLFQTIIVVAGLRYVVHKSDRRDRGISVDKRMALFAAGTFFIIVVASQFSVTLPVYANAVVGITSRSIGYVYAVNGVVVVLGQYPMSWILRKVNYVNVMILGSIFYSFGYFLVAFSGSLYWLMFDMIFITVGENLTTPGMNTVVSLIAPKDKIGRYMGFLSMSNSGGRAIGPSIGAFFLSLYSYNGLYVWGSIASLGMISIVILLIFYSAVYSKAASRQPNVI